MSDFENNSGGEGFDSSSAPVENADANSEEQGFSEGQEGQQPKPVIPAKRKYKYKADGKDYEEELDDKELERRLSLSKGAYQRMEQAAKTQKQAEQFIRMLQQDPMKILSNPQIMGQEKFREIAEQYLARQLEDQMMTPDEKKRRDEQERLRNYEEQEKTSKQKAEQEQFQKLEDHYRGEYEKTIMKGLQSQNLPKTPKTVRRMAELMAKSAENGIDLSPEHLAEIVKEDYINEMKEMFGATEGDVLLSILGEDVGNKIRKADLAKLRGFPNKVQDQRFQSQEREAPRQRIKSSDYDAHLKKKLGII